VHKQAGKTLKSGPLTFENLNANVGSPSYMAPELLTKAMSHNGKRARTHIDGEATDVYAFGVIMNAMWTKQGRSPTKFTLSLPTPYPLPTHSLPTPRF
jgi:serine/threonine protein kinase